MIHRSVNIDQVRVNRQTTMLETADKSGLAAGKFRLKEGDRRRDEGGRLKSGVRGSWGG